MKNFRAKINKKYFSILVFKNNPRLLNIFQKGIMITQRILIKFIQFDNLFHINNYIN